MFSTRYFFHTLMELEFPQIFEIFWNMKFHKNTCSGSRVVPCERTDRHDDANGRYS